MRFDNDKWKVITWMNAISLHWIINPGCAFCEMVLGMRVPRIFLVDKDSDSELLERVFVPCPDCGTIHNGNTWSHMNGTATRNWFGLYCPECGGVIPCLMSGLTAVVYGLMYPILFFVKGTWRARWLLDQPKRFENLRLAGLRNPYEGKGWIIEGLVFSAMMFVVMTFIFPLICGEKIAIVKIATSAVIWPIAGLIYGYIMKVFMESRVK